MLINSSLLGLTLDCSCCRLWCLRIRFQHDRRPEPHLPPRLLPRCESCLWKQIAVTGNDSHFTDTRHFVGRRRCSSRSRVCAQRHCHRHCFCPDTLDRRPRLIQLLCHPYLHGHCLDPAHHPYDLVRQGCTPGDSRAVQEVCDAPADQPNL